MKLGIMQPYFIPYIGYYQLINYVDKWVVFDIVQYIRHGWINRNRILKPGEGWQYIVVPLKKHRRETLIKDVFISEKTDWKDRIFRQMEHYKKKAPYYSRVRELLEESVFTEETNISVLNTKLLKKTCKYLSINFDYSVFSEINLKIGPISHAGEWALRISEALNASEYVNPYIGSDIFNKKQFDEANIDLKFLKPNLKEYNQRRNSFESGLSIIDLMMFNSPNEIKNFLNDYSII